MPSVRTWGTRNTEFAALEEVTGLGEIDPSRFVLGKSPFQRQSVLSRFPTESQEFPSNIEVSELT